MWLLLLLIVTLFLAGMLILRLRDWRTAARPDSLMLRLAPHGYHALPVEFVGHESVARFVRVASARDDLPGGRPEAELCLANDGASDEYVTLRVGGQRAGPWILSREELIALLDAHPELLSGDFTASPPFTSSSRTSEGPSRRRTGRGTT